MEIKQILNNYTDKYKNFKWEVLESEHYIFHYNKNSEAEEDINLIIRIQEDSYKKIVDNLKLEEQNKKINYFFYSSGKQKEDLMGDDGNAQVIWNDFSIHMIYTEKIKPLGEHEDTHLLTLGWGVATGFFQEGLAEYMNGCVWKNEQSIYTDSKSLILKAYNEKINIPIENFFEHKFWNNTMGNKWWYYYPLAGYFTKYLFECFGLEKYKKFYKSINRNNSKNEVIDIFENIFGNIESIKSDFENTLFNK